MVLDYSHMLKVTGIASVSIWVVGIKCVEPHRLKITRTVGVPIWGVGDKMVKGRVRIWVTGNNPKLIKRTSFAVDNGKNQPKNY